MFGKTELIYRFINYYPNEDNEFSITCGYPKIYLNINGNDYAKYDKYVDGFWRRIFTCFCNK